VRAIVTGATGFIGRRLVVRLLAEGVEVIALVRNEQHNLPPQVQTVRGDILSPETLGEWGAGCDRLYHLAALITFEPQRRDELLEVNGRGTANILAAARGWNIERSVVVSSACTIGLSYSQDCLLNEDSPLAEGLAESNPYLASKLAAERIAVTAAENQSVTIVNPTTVYGPGDERLNSGTLVRRIARSVVMPVPPGGSNVVDVDDVVEGIIAAGERGKSTRRYILGGENLSFAQIFSTIAKVVKHRPLFVPVFGWMRLPMAGAAWLAGKLVGGRFLTAQIVNDLFAFKYYSSQQARQELGWVPRHSFRESVARAWTFYRQEGLA
jgi:dihydroflavonol-4-reductase